MGITVLEPMYHSRSDDFVKVEGLVYCSDYAKQIRGGLVRCLHQLLKLGGRSEGGHSVR